MTERVNVRRLQGLERNRYELRNPERLINEGAWKQTSEMLPRLLRTDVAQGLKLAADVAVVDRSKLPALTEREWRDIDGYIARLSALESKGEYLARLKIISPKHAQTLLQDRDITTLHEKWNRRRVDWANWGEDLTTGADLKILHPGNFPPLNEDDWTKQQHYVRSLSGSGLHPVDQVAALSNLSILWPEHRNEFLSEIDWSEMRTILASSTVMAVELAAKLKILLADQIISTKDTFELVTHNKEPLEQQHREPPASIEL